MLLTLLSAMTHTAIEELLPRHNKKIPEASAIDSPFGIPSLESLQEGNSLFEKELCITQERKDTEHPATRTIRFFLTRDETLKRILLQLRTDDRTERTYEFADVPFLGVKRNPHDFIADIRIGKAAADPRSTEVILPVKPSPLPRAAQIYLKVHQSPVFSTTSAGDIQTLIERLADAKNEEPRLSIPGKTHGLPPTIQRFLDALPMDHNRVTLSFREITANHPQHAKIWETISRHREAEMQRFMTVLLPRPLPSR